MEKINIEKKWIIAVVVLAFFVVSSWSVIALPPLPNVFNGTVNYVNALSAITAVPVGVIIEAFIDYDSDPTNGDGDITTVVAGYYGYPHNPAYLWVTGEAGDDGKTVTFFVNNITANESINFDESGYPQELNLTVTDSDIPVSDIYSASSSTSTTFNIRWNGTDTTPGSGIKNYDVQYKNGTDGTWTDYLTETTLDTTTFTGVNGYWYYFQSRARDYANNVESYTGENGDTQTFVDTSTSTGGSGGGGGGTSALTTVISFTTAGVNVSLGLNSLARFAFDGAYHTIKVIKVGTNYVTLQIASDPVTVTLNLLGSRKLDLNNDNYYDLYVKLNEIKSSKAYLEVKYIHEIITPVVTPPAEEEEEEEIPEEEPEEVPEEEPEEVPEEPEEEIPPAKPKTAMIVVLAIALLAIIGLLIYEKKKR